MSSIDEFLDLQSHQGIWDSQGSFTIDQTAQLRKMQAAFLKNDTQALLKLIQALVGWGSDSIQINHCSQELSIYGSCADQRAIKTCLTEKAENLFNLVDGPHTDLVIGLSRLLAESTEQVFFSFWGRGQITELQHWLGDKEAVKLRRPPDAWQNGIGIHLQFKGTSSQCPFQFDEDDFASRVFYCPCFIYLQKKLLGIKAFRHLEFFWSTADLYKETFMSRENSDDHWFLEYFSLAAPGPNTIWPRPLYKTQTNLSPKVGWEEGISRSNDREYKSLYRLFTWGGGEPATPTQNYCKPISWAGVVTEAFRSPLTTCNGAVLVRNLRKDRNLSIYVIKRGVLISSFDIANPYPVGQASIVVVDDACPTDLSQFALPGDEVTQTVVGKAKSQLIQALQVCLDHADKAGSLTDAGTLDLTESAAYGLGALTVGGLALTGTLTLGVLPMYLAGGWLVVKTVHDWRYGDSQRSESIMGIQGWIDSLR